MEDQEISIFPERNVIYAGFWQRFAAAFIDGIIMGIPVYAIQYASGGRGWASDLMLTGHISTKSVVLLFIGTIANWIYSAAMESAAAQATIGKMALGIIVTDVYGSRISFAKASGRFFAKYVSSITLLIGYLMMLWNDKHQALHDKMAGTLVVNK